MSLPVHRLGDCNSGHDCFPPQTLCSASSNVLSNGIPIGRVGDCYTVHCCESSCHSSVVATGSPNVLINGRNVARLGGLVSCGGVAVCSSPNVLV